MQSHLQEVVQVLYQPIVVFDEAISIRGTFPVVGISLA
jgi:hypothetical protein